MCLSLLCVLFDCIVLVLLLPLLLLLLQVPFFDALVMVLADSRADAAERTACMEVLLHRYAL
jgi:hypothetical protein